ncbi:hypothetical protein GUJ93_ZPchr0009g229 [Zizania palustris]|uniref:Uncharacterized protein n=1 Tax=Zizania palustris TaxID=103762 RepID=A0A8J5V6K3_ZIZPA|nr:hypothetical protein GUJ93_ZPchr0009g229 [Zizania palustris]
MNVGGGGSSGAAGKDSAYVCGGPLLELTPHKLAVCHLVQVFAPPPPPPQTGVAAPAPPFPFESVAHHNRLQQVCFLPPSRNGAPPVSAARSPLPKL